MILATSVKQTVFGDYSKLPTKGQPKMVGKEKEEEKEVWVNEKS